MPVSQVNPEQKEKYMAQERGKRREFLNKFLNACSTARVGAPKPIHSFDDCISFGF